MSLIDSFSLIKDLVFFQQLQLRYSLSFVQDQFDSCNTGGNIMVIQGTGAPIQDSWFVKFSESLKARAHPDSIITPVPARMIQYWKA